MSAVILSYLIIIVFDFIVRFTLKSHNELTLLSFLLSAITGLAFWTLLRLLQGAVQNFSPKIGYKIFAAAISFYITTLLVCSFFAFWKLGDYINSYQLTFLMSDLRFAWDAIYLYGLSWPGLGLIPIFILFYKIWSRPANPTQAPMKMWKRGLAIFFCLLLALVGAQQLKFETVGHHKFPDASFLLAIKNFTRTNRFNVLHTSVRQNLQPVNQGLRPDIFFYLGESLGKQHLTFYGHPSLSAPAINNIFMQKNARAFSQGLSNSSATDVSLPSLLSAVGPEESDVKLHELPLLWDWLRAAGYYTVFVSPQKFSFSSMDSFFMSPGPDRLMTADRFNSIQRLVSHNNGIDDITAAKIAVEDLKKEVPNNKPLFLIYFSNATHYPFLQTSTELTEQPHFKTKYENSQFIADTSYKVLQDYFASRARSIIYMISGDHGEIETTKTPVPRIASFYDEVLSVPFAFSFSDDILQDSHGKSCIDNIGKLKDSLVQNIDLVPTLVDLLSLNSNEANHQVISKSNGKSLCSLSPKDAENRIIISLNTNNIRQWNPEGFLIAKNNWRFVFTNTEGPQIFNLKEDPDQTKNIFSPDHPFFQKDVFTTIKNNLHLNRIWQQWGPKDLH